ncbi:nucleotide exchange factor GrpE [Helicobacter sp. CLO-3]|nr:nucleotide exchange factor GrpE [Helicobacter sp. CLO-3]OHU84564.1 nucleotide exchange factor GrpE [Helicobacter sp. CLO-3]
MDSGAQDSSANAESNAESSGENSQDSSDESSADSAESKDSSELDSLKLAYKDLEERYLRTHADFENVKKRLERDKNQALEYAYEKIAKDLLPILDALDGAKEAAKENPAILEGVSLVRENLAKVLAKHGVEEIAAQGEFDPNLHECVMQMAKPEVQEGHIAQVLQTGYKYKERTLRPAMVAVAKNG